MTNPDIEASRPFFGLHLPFPEWSAAPALFERLEAVGLVTRVKIRRFKVLPLEIAAPTLRLWEALCGQKSQDTVPPAQQLTELVEQWVARLDIASGETVEVLERVLQNCRRAENLARIERWRRGGKSS